MFKVYAYWPDGQVFERLGSFQDRSAADTYVKVEDKREAMLAAQYYAWGIVRDLVQFEVREVK